MPLPLILASASPRRRELLASLGLLFRIVRPDIDETQYSGEPPLEYVQRLSIEKARAVAGQLEGEALVLAADTVVILDREIIGKPGTPDEARAMLRLLRDRAHTVCTALTLLQPQPDAPATRLTQLTQTRVLMRNYSDAEIEAYIASGDPFDKAGGYAIQHEGFRPVARIEGSYSNVVGLPVETLRQMLGAIRYPGFDSADQPQS